MWFDEGEPTDMKQTKLINNLWLLLIFLTLFSAYMAEKATPNFNSVAIMALVLAIKGRIIVDYFIEWLDDWCKFIFTLFLLWLFWFIYFLNR